MAKRKRFYGNEAKLFLDLIWNDHVHKPPVIKKDRLCDILDLKHLQMIHMCKRNFGMTYRVLLQHCRVAESKQLLAANAKSDMQIAAIAEVSGFSSHQRFSEDFKKITGMTPTEFKYFHKHFYKTTKMHLAVYNFKNENLPGYYGDYPTFFSNLLNRYRKKL